MPNPASGRSKPASAWPIPTPGDVLAYAYLWDREAARGQEEGLKDRPVVVVLATVIRDSKVDVYVAPITHANPGGSTVAIELPADVNRELRLDKQRSWIICDEGNRFVWPGPDVRMLADNQPFYGAVPD